MKYYKCDMYIVYDYCERSGEQMGRGEWYAW